MQIEIKPHGISEKDWISLAQQIKERENHIKTIKLEIINLKKQNMPDRANFDFQMQSNLAIKNRENAVESLENTLSYLRDKLLRFSIIELPNNSPPEHAHES